MFAVVALLLNEEAAELTNQTKKDVRFGFIFKKKRRTEGKYATLCRQLKDHELEKIF